MNLCTAGEHEIITSEGRPIYRPNHKLPVHYEEMIDTEIKKNLKLGILKNSNSLWSSPIIPVAKKDGSLRMCIDFRGLNQRTIKDAYPKPRIDEILDSLANVEIFSILDATTGYCQIAMSKSSTEKTAFGWKGGHYEFMRLLFGLCNFPATFQRAMDRIFEKERGNFIIPYLDDIIVYSKNFKEHQEHLRITLGRIKASGLTLNPKKCVFNKQEIKILGNVISKGIVKPDPEKVEAIKNYARPETVKELRLFLGLANYYRDFIIGFAELATPMTDKLKGEIKRSNKKIIWSEA